MSKVEGIPERPVLANGQGEAAATDPENMLERLALTLFRQATNITAKSFNEWPGIEPELWRNFAREVLVAIREPTETQYEALSATDKMWRQLDSRTVWQVFIDAALQETRS